MKPNAPTVTTGRGSDTIENHPSFGLIGAARITSSRGTNLFGSAIRHNAFMRVTIRGAEKIRNLNQDWFHGKDVLIEIDMSEDQWAQMICTPNIGDGVPCTLGRIAGEEMPECPEVNERKSIDDEFKADMKELASKMDELVFTAEAMLHKDRPKKGDAEDLLKKAKSIRQAIGDNLPFVQEQFNRRMDQIVTEAKGEMQSHALQVLNSMGVQAMREKLEAMTPTKFIEIKEGQ